MDKRVVTVLFMVSLSQWLEDMDRVAVDNFTWLSVRTCTCVLAICLLPSNPQRFCLNNSVYIYLGACMTFCWPSSSNQSLYRQIARRGVGDHRVGQ